MKQTLSKIPILNFPPTQSSSSGSRPSVTKTITKTKSRTAEASDSPNLSMKGYDITDNLGPWTVPATKIDCGPDGNGKIDNEAYTSAVAAYRRQCIETQCDSERIWGDCPTDIYKKGVGLCYIPNPNYPCGPKPQKEDYRRCHAENGVVTVHYTVTSLGNFDQTKSNPKHPGDLNPPFGPTITETNIQGDCSYTGTLKESDVPEPAQPGAVTNTNETYTKTSTEFTSCVAEITPPWEGDSGPATTANRGKVFFTRPGAGIENVHLLVTYEAPYLKVVEDCISSDSDFHYCA